MLAANLFSLLLFFYWILLFLWVHNLVYSWSYNILNQKGRPGLNGKKGAKGDSGGGYGYGYQVSNEQLNTIYFVLIVTTEVYIILYTIL